MAVVSVRYTFCDSRQRLEKLNLNDYFSKYFPEDTFPKESIPVWLHSGSLDAWIMYSEFQTTNFVTSTIFNDSSSILEVRNRNLYYWSVIFQKLGWHNVFFPMDLSCWNSKEFLSLSSVFSCFFKKNFNIFFFNFSEKRLFSLSLIHSSYIWVEREAKEFFGITFLGLKDSRRLLTDYTVLEQSTDQYETRGYNTAIQDIFFKGLLHWLFVFIYLFLCMLVSICFLNRGFLSLLLVSEIILLLLFFLAMSVAIFYNIYYMLVISFFVLVFGGLELCINLLIIFM